MKQLTILVTATIGWGHINACSGAVEQLHKRGHRIIFVTREGFREKLIAQGYEVFVYQSTKSDDAKDNRFAGDMLEYKVVGASTTLENLINTVTYLNSPLRIRDVSEQDRGVSEAIEKYKPDLIYRDGNALLPSIHYSGIPWVRNISTAPLYYVMDNAGMPPGGSGLPANGDQTDWPMFNSIRRGLFYTKTLNDSIEDWGYDRFPDDMRAPWSQSLTVYGYPDELNFEQIRRRNWFNLEVFNKNTAKEVVPLNELVPERFMSDTLDGRFTGKWIFVSMGSLASVDLQLMKRLAVVLSKTNHKFIFSKGHRCEEFTLPRNSWGDRFLPQTKILPLVDLVITHGGNNTVTETFAQGKPMILLPNFMDQFDNAQHETGFGIRLDTYNFTDDELIEAVDKLIYDRELYEKLDAASKRIQSNDRHTELAIKIEQMLADK